MSGAFTQEMTDEGILVLILDVPGAKVNTLSRALRGEFDALLTRLEGRNDVRGVVLRSGKPEGFIAGADIRDFTAIRTALEAEALSREGQALLARLAALKTPVVAAIHGPCLGGGLEMALACRYRVATDDAKTVIGLPEVMLGIIPGAGGTQRLPRLIGLRAGLDLILTGRSLKAAKALRVGLVDEVVAAPLLVQAARAAALRLAAGEPPPERIGITAIERMIRPVIFRQARASVREKTGGRYPAPIAALEVIEEGTSGSLERGLELEARRFGELAVSEVSRALVSVFLATQEIKKDAGYPEGTKANDVRKLAVVGAGLMGAGIATSAAEAGADVRLKDTTFGAIGRGLRHAREQFEARRRRGSLGTLDMERRMNRLSGTIDGSGFARAQLVIEAVFEDLGLKRTVLAEVEEAVGDDCVVASNTSSIPIGDLARGARRPNRILGMHFFSPVEKMPLLEVVVAPETDAWATATAVGFGRRLGKHVIVVRDGPGFYTTRALSPYLSEGARLVEEGAAVEDVDAAMKRFGFPVGPLALLDEVGIDVGARVAGVLHAAFGARMAPPAAMTAVLESGRLGRKGGRGFYRYDGARKRPDESMYALLPRGLPRTAFAEREIQERLVFAFLNEAARCLQDGILRSARDGDVGAIFGLGFPPFLGGPFRYLDHLGPRFAVEVLDRLAARHGERFTPAAILRDMGRDGRSFHPAETAAP